MDIIGKLEVFNVVDILQMLSMTKRNGALTLRSGQKEGSIYIKDGRVVDANLERWRGVSAVNKILTWKEGNFEFHEGAKSPGETINVRTDNLLLDGLRRLDEWKHLQGGAKGGKIRFSIQSSDPLIRRGLSAEEQKFLGLIDGRRSLKEVAKAGNFTEEGALAIASELFLTGILDTEESLNVEVEIPTAKKKEGLSRQELQEIIDYLRSY